jgi:hypothetical protein
MLCLPSSLTSRSLRLNYILWLQDVQYTSTLADAFSSTSVSTVQGLDMYVPCQLLPFLLQARL